MLAHLKIKAAKILCITFVVRQFCADVIFKHNCYVPIHKGKRRLQTETISLDGGCTMYNVVLLQILQAKKSSLHTKYLGKFKTV